MIDGAVIAEASNTPAPDHDLPEPVTNAVLVAIVTAF